MVKNLYLIDGILTGITTVGQVDLGVMTMKGSLTFPKALGLEPSHLIKFKVIPRRLVGESYSSVQMQLAYSKAPSDWACLHS